MRAHIIQEIRRIAELAGGQPPGWKAFYRDTAIPENQWRGKFWARWGDALIEAGFQPNEWQSRLDSETVLLGVVSACRHYGWFPTSDEIQLHRGTDPTIPSSLILPRFSGHPC